MFALEVCEVSGRACRIGPVNSLYSDGDVMFVHGHVHQRADGSIRAPGLHYISVSCNYGLGHSELASVKLESPIGCKRSPWYRPCHSPTVTGAHCTRVNYCDYQLICQYPPGPTIFSSLFNYFRPGKRGLLVSRPTNYAAFSHCHPAKISGFTILFSSLR